MEKFQGGTVIKHQKNIPPGLRERGKKKKEEKKRRQKREKWIRSRPNVSSNLEQGKGLLLLGLSQEYRMCMRIPTWLPYFPIQLLELLILGKKIFKIPVFPVTCLKKLWSVGR